METVCTSKDSNLAEKLMREIMDKDDKQLFAAMLYNCYSLIKPDVAMELAWRKDMFEYVMPFFI
jgi:clathrin heavy chain